MDDPAPKTTRRAIRDEPLSPKCSACREPGGTCFPSPCKAYWRAVREQDAQNKADMDWLREALADGE